MTVRPLHHYLRYHILTICHCEHFSPFSAPSHIHCQIMYKHPRPQIVKAINMLHSLNWRCTISLLLALWNSPINGQGKGSGGKGPSNPSPTASPTSGLYDFIVGDDTMTWGEAEDWCLNNYNRHLVSIHNNSQNEAASAVCDDCWIGATCKDSSWSDWEWSDSSSWTYTAWNSGEPNDAGYNEDCVHQYAGGSWNDVACDATYRPLCGNEGTL